MSYRLKQPDANGDCCCRDDCGNCANPAVSFTCASRTGSGSLAGWAKFQNQNSGDINKRIATRYRIHGSSVTGESCFRCSADAACSGGCDLYRTLPEQDAEGYITALGTTAASKVGILGYCGGTYMGVMSTDAPDSGGRAIGQCDFFCSIAGATFTRAIASDWEDTRTGNSKTPSYGCVADPFACPAGSTHRQPNAQAGGGVLTTTLIEFDSVHAALVRAEATEGSLCRTTVNSVGSVTAAALTTLSITGDSVVAALACTGLTAGHDYRITLTISRYTAGGGAFVDTYEETIDFTASGTTEDIDFNLPVNTDYDYALADAGDVAIADIT